MFSSNLQKEILNSFKPFNEYSVIEDAFKPLMNEGNKDFTLNLYKAFPFSDFIKDSDGNYKLNIAVAGFGKTELSVSVDSNIVTITGVKSETENNDITYFFKGISTKNFVKKFKLHSTLTPSKVKLSNGLLSITLKEVEAKSGQQLDIEEDKN